MIHSVVLGGSGLIGRHLVKYLAAQGQRVSIHCKNTDVAFMGIDRARLFRDDFVTGEGLREALEGADHCYQLICSTSPET